MQGDFVCSLPLVTNDKIIQSHIKMTNVESEQIIINPNRYRRFERKLLKFSFVKGKRIEENFQCWRTTYCMNNFGHLLVEKIYQKLIMKFMKVLIILILAVAGMPRYIYFVFS